jgi:hypothetical protein
MYNLRSRLLIPDWYNNNDLELYLYVSWIPCLHVYSLHDPLERFIQEFIYIIWCYSHFMWSNLMASLLSGNSITSVNWMVYWCLVHFLNCGCRLIYQIKLQDIGKIWNQKIQVVDCWLIIRSLTHHGSIARENKWAMVKVPMPQSRKYNAWHVHIISHTIVVRPFCKKRSSKVAPDFLKH